MTATRDDTRDDDRNEVTGAALAELRRTPGIDYAEVRVVEDERDILVLRNGEVDRVIRTTSAGVGVRVLRHGAWGFAARPSLDPAAAVAAAQAAAEIAAGVAVAIPVRVQLAEEEPQRGHYETPVEIDPFTVPLERRIADLTAASVILRDGDARAIQSTAAWMSWTRSRKLLCSSEGTHVAQTLVYGGAGLRVVAADDDGAVVRSWPLDHDGGLAAAGYEHIAHLDLPHHAARIRDEALELLAAPLCPSNRTTLVIDTPQLALQIHESCGHPTESDRAMGDELSLAGGSFLTPDKLGRFTYGSTHVNLTADSRAPGGLGTFGWDDEGVPARTTPLIARGQFVGYLSSRETAAALGLGRSAGCMRAESWSRPPIIRMINVSLEPDPAGPATLDELIADTGEGILVGTNRSWSIDDLRLNFQFGCEAAWEIRRGRRARMLRNPVYTGSTPAFWRGCDAVGAPSAWRLWGFSSCGKGDPVQGMSVGHGCAPARFRDVEVGASR